MPDDGYCKPTSFTVDGRTLVQKSLALTILAGCNKGPHHYGGFLRPTTFLERFRQTILGRDDEVREPFRQTISADCD